MTTLNNWGKYEGDALKCSPSRLICFREDPEIYHQKYIEKIKDDTESMDFGKLAHMATFEPHKLSEKYVIMPEKTATNDLSKEELVAMCVCLGLKKTGNKADLIKSIREVSSLEPQLDEIENELIKSDRILLPPKTLLDALTIAKKILSHPILAKHLEGAEFEKRGYYTDEETGVVMRFQTDATKKYSDFGLIIDLKITKDWDSYRFDATNFTTGRHIQGYSYCKGVSKIENFPYNRVLFIAVEPKSPFRVRAYEMDEGALDAGRSEHDYYLKEFKERLTKNDWSPRPNDIRIQTTTLRHFEWERVKEVHE
jgi:hypothetical protein